MQTRGLATCADRESRQRPGMLKLFIGGTANSQYVRIEWRGALLVSHPLSGYEKHLLKLDRN
jgi:hypothetical protein